MNYLSAAELDNLDALRSAAAAGAYYDDMHSTGLTDREEYRAAFWRYLIANRADDRLGD